MTLVAAIVRQGIFSTVPKYARIYQIEISHGLSSLNPPMLNPLARFPNLWHAWQLKTPDFARNPVIKRGMRAVIQTLFYHPQYALCGGHKPLQIGNSCYAWIW